MIIKILGNQTVPNNTETTTAMPIVGLDVNSFANQSVIGANETTSILTESFASNNTLIEILPTNNTATTLLTETIGQSSANNTGVSLQSNITQISDGITSGTTDNISTTISDMLFTSTRRPGDENNIIDKHSGDSLDGQYQTLFIALGSILVVLVFILIVLWMIYRKYKRRNNIGYSSGGYCVTDLKEISTSSGYDKAMDPEQCPKF